MYQVQVPLANLPLSLILVNNGTLAFVRTHNFKTIFDQPEKGISATFTEENFLLGNDEVVYNYDVLYNYKEIPEMLQWLKEQKL